MITKTSSQKPTALNEWTYQYLKEKILNLEISPGEQIHIEDFMEKLEVSRTPIREAFLRLANEGLVVVKPRVGYFVGEITEDDIRDLFEVRELIETRAARKAAELLSDEEIKTIEQLLNESEEAVKKNNIDKYLENEIEFHDYLQKHIQNKRFIAFMDSINDLTYRERKLSVRSAENIKQTLVEHRRILEALQKKDSQQAEWFMGEHIHNVSIRLIEIVKKLNKQNLLNNRGKNNG